MNFCTGLLTYMLEQNIIQGLNIIFLIFFILVFGWCFPLRFFKGFIYISRRSPANKNKIFSKTLGLKHLHTVFSRYGRCLKAMFLNKKESFVLTSDSPVPKVYCMTYCTLLGKPSIQERAVTLFRAALPPSPPRPPIFISITCFAKFSLLYCRPPSRPRTGPKSNSYSQGCHNVERSK